MNNEPYGWVKNGEYVLYIEKPDSVFNYIPLYTHQYERPHNTVLVPCDKLAEMQAEIEALKQIIDANNLSQNIGQFVKPTNEPVAWMDKESNITMIGGIYPKKLEQYLNSLESRIFALETHPIKELTDEEIREIWEIVSLKWWDWENSFDVTGFARAILKRAQEK